MPIDPRQLQYKHVQELAARITEAVAADEKSEGCDISAGLFGTEFSELIVEMADAMLAAQDTRR